MQTQNAGKEEEPREKEGKSAHATEKESHKIENGIRECGT